MIILFIDSFSRYIILKIITTEICSVISLGKHKLNIHKLNIHKLNKVYVFAFSKCCVQSV
jgi:hypothetical protein